MATHRLACDERRPGRRIGIAGDAQLAGFRPEHIQLGAAREPSIGFEAAIEVVEYLGDEQLVHLRRHEHALVAKLPVEPRLTGSTRAALAVPLDKIALFDAVTGEALEASAAPIDTCLPYRRQPLTAG